MATAALHPTHLLFSDAAAADQCRITPGAGFATFGGPASAAVELRNIATATLAGSAVPKSQADALIAAQEATASAARTVIADAVTAEQASRAAGDLATAAAAAAALSTSEGVAAAARTVLSDAITAAAATAAAATAAEAVDRVAGDAASVATAAAALTASETSAAAARATLSAAIAQEVADRAAGDSVESAARIAADAAAATTNSDARAVIAASVAAETTRATAAEAAAQAGAQTYTDGLIATEQADRATAIQAAQNGVHWKDSVRVCANVPLPANAFAGGVTLTANAAGVLTVDGVATALNDRILVNAEAGNKKAHGIYKVTTAGAAGAAFVLTREPDFADGSQPVATAVLVREGTAAADQAFIMTSDGATVSSDDISFSVFSTPGEMSVGQGLSLSGKQVSVADGGISEAMLKDNAVTAAKIAAGAVGASELANNACDTAAIQDDAVTDAKCSFTHVQATQGTFGGQVQAASYVATSDERLKEQISDMNPEDCSEMVGAMRCCEYRFKNEPGQQRYGTIAQNCQAHGKLKHLVRENEEGNLAVCYQDMIAVMCASLKHAHELIAQLMAEAECA